MARPRRICIIPECGLPAWGRGWCQKHYYRWRRYGRLHLLDEQPTRGTKPRHPLPSNLTREQWLAWAAGFVDGEGCITISHRRSDNGHFVVLTVVQIAQAPLHILQSLFGGSISAKTRYRSDLRQVWFWKTTTKQAGAALVELRPYLVVKAAEADIAIEFQRSIGRAIKNSVTPEDRIFRQTLREKMQALKR